MLWIVVSGADVSALEKSISSLERSGEYRKNPVLADSLARLYLDLCSYRASVSDCDKAVAIYEKYVKNSSIKRAKALMRKAEVQKGREEYGEAMTTYREAISTIGGGTNWQEGGMVELTSNIDLILSAAGNYYLMKGMLALRDGKYADAITSFDAALKYLTKVKGTGLDLARAYHGRGVAYCRLGKSEKAIEDLKMAVTLLRKLSMENGGDVAIGYELGMSLYHLGNAYLKQGKYIEAARSYEEASFALMGIPHWESRSKVVLSVGRTYVKRAEALHRSGKFGEAVKLYKRGIKHLNLARKLCRKDKRYCPTKEEIRSARKHLKQAAGKKGYK